MKRGSVVVGYLDPGQWSASFGLSYRDLCLYDAASSQRIVRPSGAELRQVCASGGIAEARNDVARAFLDTDGEWLWFVDSDMGFAADTVDRLVASADRYAAPVMGGLCFALRRTARPSPATLNAPEFAIIPTCYAYAETGDEVGFLPIQDYGRDQVIKVAGTGAACLLIHRDVLVKVRATYGDAWFDPIT
ncbi:MAG TPA: glycosyltransferase family A protein, partial [Armatimonadota bacterium]|nr:glycosyltransferase family A protein [Armatimonadota bacterium]